MSVFIIAEAGSSHDNDLQKAYRLIEAAKECGADACKFQFWSSPHKLAQRRGLGADAEAMYAKYQLPQGWLPLLKEHCDRVGIEFMVTCYLLEDIKTINPFVKRFKISAYESLWKEFCNAHLEYGKQRIISINGRQGSFDYPNRPPYSQINLLHCVSKYPTPIEELKLSTLNEPNKVQLGLSDHTDSIHTGGWAVHHGAAIIEKHIRLFETSQDNPDFAHSLPANIPKEGVHWDTCTFLDYVGLIREAEKAL